MTENNPQATSDDEALRKRLLNRIAVAGVVIVGLLAGLAAFDALNTPTPPQKQAKVEEAPPVPISKPLAEAKPDAVVPALEEKKGAIPTEPERTSAPEALPLPEPKEERPLTKPATAKRALLHKQTPSAAVAVAEPDQEPSAAAQSPTPTPAPHTPVGPITRAVEAVRQYMLQLGVFSNPVNAEELRAKLSQNGIPAQIESRVQVGPFKTKKEAEETRQKLIALGVEPGIVLAVKK
jgi:cell division protein FtsN